MSINDIMKYVNKTPGNTNPSVIASMVKGEMNDTLKEAKEYTDNAFRELGIDKETKKTTYSGTLEVYGEVSTHIQTGKVFGLVAGNTYTIALDSGTYTAVAKSDGNGGVYFGNDSAMGGEDTGETYCVGEILVTTDTWQTGVTDLNCGTKYTITTETETIHPIKPEYLPGVCLPVVEISNFKGFAELTAEEKAQLQNAFATSKYAMFVLSMYEGTESPILCHYKYNEDAGDMFLGSFIAYEDGVMKAKKLYAFVSDGVGIVMAENFEGE